MVGVECTGPSQCTFALHVCLRRSDVLWTWEICCALSWAVPWSCISGDYDTGGFCALEAISPERGGHVGGDALAHTQRPVLLLNMPGEYHKFTDVEVEGRKYSAGLRAITYCQCLACTQAAFLRCLSLWTYRIGTPVTRNSQHLPSYCCIL